MDLSISMDRFWLAILASPFCISGILLNIFFFFCLIHPAVGVSIRPPLRFLLTAQLCNSTVQQCIITLSVVLAFLGAPNWLLVVNIAIMFQTYCSNFSTSAWISMFYYLKIVPQRWAPFVWIKKNIEVMAYSGFIFDQILLLSALSMGALAYLPTSSTNSTASIINMPTDAGAMVMNDSLYKLATKVFLLYLIVPFFSLSTAWGKTFVYLREHMKRMEESTGSSSSPQQKNQMRVTVMGIVQTTLFIPSTLWAIAMALLFGSAVYEQVDYDKHITMTFCAISGLANIICLGFSQSVFRLRVTAILKSVKKAFGLVDAIEQQ